MGRILLTIALVLAWNATAEVAPQAGWSHGAAQAALPVGDEQLDEQAAAETTLSGVLSLFVGPLPRGFVPASQLGSTDGLTSLRRMSVLWQV